MCGSESVGGSGSMGGSGSEREVFLSRRAIPAARSAVDESPSSAPSRGGSRYSAEPLASTAGAAAALVKLPRVPPKSVSPWYSMG